MDRFEHVAFRIVAFGALVWASLLALVGWGYAFAIGTTCTNHYSCTENWCPAACDRIGWGMWLNVAGQVAAVAAFALATGAMGIAAAVMRSWNA